MSYLAWMRSAIALIGFGVLIGRLPLLRHFAVRNDIKQDTYEPPDSWVILSGLTVLLLGLGVIYYVFNVPLELLNTVLIE